jgi:hypothetical protein
MITSNLDTIIKELDQYQKEIERKIKAMVSGFASDVAFSASEHTPVASPRVIENYMNSYKARRDQYGVEIAPGYHAGAWKYAEGAITFDPNIYVEEQVQADALKDSRNQYRIGDTFKIGAIGFAYEALNKGHSQQAPDGIIKPTEQAIKASFASDVKLHFDRG